MNSLKLYMVIIGCKPKGRYTEQHDVFFGIAESLKELVPHMNEFWPETKGKFHIDAWREVTRVNGYSIEVKKWDEDIQNEQHLFFINLGGYKPGEFDELHYKLLSVGPDSATAISEAKQTVFYKTAGFKGATSHIDDKYALDVDDLYHVKDMLLPLFKETYKLKIKKKEAAEDELHLGYVTLSKLIGKD